MIFVVIEALRISWFPALTDKVMLDFINMFSQIS